MVVRNATVDPSIRPALRVLGYQTVLGVPLFARKKLVAVLEVGSFADREFTDDETAFLQLIGQQAAIAIENSSLYEEARELNRLKDRFLSVASHELRTPLTAILGWTSLLKRASDDSVRAEAMEAIEGAARTQAELIEDLLDASRVREGKLRLQRETIDLASVVTAALKAVEPAASERGVKLEADIPTNAPPIQGDAHRIRQVVWNLLTNAIKFTPWGKRVKTSVAVDEKMATIIVADEGDGISPDFLPYIFDELQQEEKGKRAGGLGLGLFIVKTIVDMHGGSVEALSDGPGRGATFIVRLPVS
jgi:signal transduction histidine kinase